MEDGGDRTEGKEVEAGLEADSFGGGNSRSELLQPDHNSAEDQLGLQG